MSVEELLIARSVPADSSYFYVIGTLRSHDGKPNETPPVSRLGSWLEPQAASLFSCPTPAAYAAGVI